jgi:hypothetical protein
VKQIMLWALLSHPHPSSGIFLTVDILDQIPPEEKVCPVSQRDLEREGCWEQPPNILICHGAPMNRPRVLRALNYWERLGYTFGTVTSAPNANYSCATGIVPRSTIMIDIPSQNFRFGTHLGTTRTWRDTAQVCNGMPLILKSKVEIIPAWGETERILEHELGHALGWNDINSVGHIMHGSWSLGGTRTSGLNNE